VIHFLIGSKYGQKASSLNTSLLALLVRCVLNNIIRSPGISAGTVRPCGPGNSVGIATDYGLDDPGIESRWGCRRDFPHLSRPALGPPSLLYNGYRVFPRIQYGRGVTLTIHPLLVPRSHGRVELYLYPPSGPHRACNGVSLPLLTVRPSCSSYVNSNSTWYPANQPDLCLESASVWRKILQNRHLWKCPDSITKLQLA
jgi:hypothetical protein